MIALIKSLLGLGEKVNVKELIANGAIVLDVRSPAEFKDGHIKGALNFPLQNLTSQMNKLKKEQVIVTCCRSGSRSGMAKRMLKSNGFQEVQFIKLENCGMHHFFDVIVCSEFIGKNKPDPAIFHYAMKEAGTKASDSLMIGDDYRIDVAGVW